MTDKQPEALRWANILEHQAQYDGATDYKHKAAAELRRLHEVNAELVEALKAALSDDQPYIEKCKAALAKVQGDNNG
jgi:hypothetical protein